MMKTVKVEIVLKDSVKPNSDEVEKRMYDAFEQQRGHCDALGTLLARADASLEEYVLPPVEAKLARFEAGMDTSEGLKHLNASYHSHLAELEMESTEWWAVKFPEAFQHVRANVEVKTCCKHRQKLIAGLQEPNPADGLVFEDYDTQDVSDGSCEIESCKDEQTKTSFVIESESSLPWLVISGNAGYSNPVEIVDVEVKNCADDSRCCSDEQAFTGMDTGASLELTSDDGSTAPWLTAIIALLAAAAGGLIVGVAMCVIAKKKDQKQMATAAVEKSDEKVEGA
jgi:hypothetical protein